MIDLHLHTTYSDGTDTLEDLIENISKSEIDYFSITDHDTANSARRILTSEELKQKIKDNNLTYVTGIEYSCVFNGRNMHILAYDINPFTSEVQELEKDYKYLSEEKDVFRFKVIEDAGFVLSEKSREFLKTRENIRDPDIANCLVNDGYFDNIETVFSEFIRKIKYPKKYLLDPIKVIKNMKKIGAKLVWAHSLFGLNQKPLDYNQVEEIIIELKKHGLDGLECYYSLYNGEQIEELKKLAQKYGLFITCGSDYHGKNKKIKLLERSCDGSLVDESDVNIIKTFKNVVN